MKLLLHQGAHAARSWYTPATWGKRDKASFTRNAPQKLSSRVSHNDRPTAVQPAKYSKHRGSSAEAVTRTDAVTSTADCGHSKHTRDHASPARRIALVEGGCFSRQPIERVMPPLRIYECARQQRRAGSYSSSTAKAASAPRPPKNRERGAGL